MSFRKYQKVLAIPRVMSATLFMFVAGLPLTIMTLTLSLHVLNEMGHSYFDAGVVATATALGFAVGSPLVGRMMDRHGLRPVVALCGALSTLAWVSLPVVNYVPFVALAFAAGVFTIPTGSLSRQFVASLVPEDQRRPAYSLTTMLMELSFVITPALGILLITTYSATAVLFGIGAWRAASYIALYVLNWPIRDVGESAPSPDKVGLKWRQWFSARLLSVLLVSAGALFVLFGTELALIAVLRENGEIAYTGYVIAVMSIASITGGFVHGMVHRSWSLMRLAVTMSLLLLPVVFFDQVWWLLMLALLPTNLLCTPTLAASSEAVAKLAPASVRGQVMGLQDSANRLGQTLSMPLVGFAIDTSSPAMGFVAAASGGLVLIGVAALFDRWVTPTNPSA
ncbi:MFS transporter [Pseudomonas sp. GD03842]|uniref:MFS transporter n=1 Tax=Pseudomonas sp. GD03842 TaxID=2975385 RepID=UPI002448E5F3|nr:MFS transporter [Pseudomonas sp. GD03842]MDH0746095.1 MFS transporter [Pseudomonas sp. GD03842]